MCVCLLGCLDHGIGDLLLGKVLSLGIWKTEGDVVAQTQIEQDWLLADDRDLVS